MRTNANLREKDVQKVILDWVNTLPDVKVWRRNVGAFGGEYKGKKRFIRFGQRGQADLEGIAPGGIHIEIETKRPKNSETTFEQRVWIDDLVRHGAIAFFASNLDQCVEMMRIHYQRRGMVWDWRWEPR